MNNSFSANDDYKFDIDESENNNVIDLEDLLGAASNEPQSD